MSIKTNILVYICNDFRNKKGNKMEIIIGKSIGFCPGVKNALAKAEEFMDENNNNFCGEIYCLGEMLHNRQVREELENKGMITVYNLNDVPNGSTVFFRAHGEAENVYEFAKSKNLNVIDLTCARVKIIHDLVKKHKETDFIIIIGKKNHPEVLATQGFAGENNFVIETEDDILDAYMEYEKTNLGKVYIVSQTTISSKNFDKLSKAIENNFAEAEVIIEKTICNATEKRQKEAKELSKKVNSMVIIGGKNSTNTKELAEISRKNCGKVYYVETVEELKNIDFSNDDKVGIMAGASTPQYSIDEVKEFLEKI